MSNCDLAIHGKVSGRYKIEKGIESTGEKTYEGGWFNNLVTNNGLDIMETTKTYLQSCSVGTSATTPLFTDTALGALKASTTTAQAVSYGVSGTVPYYMYVRITYRFAAGVAAGNIAEVGVGTSATNLFSHALILNSSSSPTTITVLSDEYLDVTYELRYYMPTTDVTGAFNLNGVDYTYISRAAEVLTGELQVSTSTWKWAFLYGASYAGASIGGVCHEATSTTSPGMLRASTSNISPITSGLGVDPSSQSIYCQDSNVLSTYILGTYYRDITYTYGLTKANIGGIRQLYGHIGFGTYQIQFTPAIPKTSSDIFTFKIRMSWGRY